MSEYRKTRKTIESRLSAFREHYKVETYLNTDFDGRYNTYKLNIRTNTADVWTPLTNYLTTDEMIEVINSFIHMMEFIKGEKPVFPVA
jgi:hypothetical protein